MLKGEYRMKLPDWLVEALDGWAPGAYPYRGTKEFHDLMDGDIVRVGGMDLSEPNRLVAVLEVDVDRRCFLGALITDELNLATAEDLILDSDHTGLPYQVAVMSGLAMHIWFVQVEERLGALSEETLEAAVAGYYGAEDKFLTAHRGIPLQARMMDLRWPEYEREGDQLAALAEDCVTKRGDEDIELPYVDPRLLPVLDGSINGAPFGTLSVLEEAARAGRTRGVSPSCLEQIAQALDRRVLRAFPNIFQPMGQTATSPPARRDEDDQGDWLFKLTIADGLAGAGFVKVIGGDDHSEPTRFDSNGRRYEFLYETVKETSV